MTAITTLRNEIKRHAPDSSVAKLLSWAEIEMGDLHDRIHELEADLTGAEKDNARRTEALFQVKLCLSANLNDFAEWLSRNGIYQQKFVRQAIALLSSDAVAVPRETLEALVNVADAVCKMRPDYPQAESDRQSIAQAVSQGKAALTNTPPSPDTADAVKQVGIRYPGYPDAIVDVPQPNNAETGE